ELRGERRKRLLLLAAVRAAELTPAHELDAGKALAQALLQDLENDVALEQLVPQLGDRLSLERAEPRRERARLLLAHAARPVDFVVSVVGVSGHGVISFARILRDRDQGPGTSSLSWCT